MPLSVMSFNVLYEGLEDVAVPWPERVGDVASLIRFHDPTLVGLQECWMGQTDDIEAALPEYEWFGENRDVGTHTPVGVDRERARIRDRETFWLAPDADDRRPAWDATLPRLVTHVTVEEAASGATVELYNVHLAVEGERARVESARILRERFVDHDDPVILVGDCNCKPGSRPYGILTDALDDARERVDCPYGPFETYHGYDRDEGKRIDYVFASSSVSVTRHGVLTDRAPNWLSPSDHWPVLASVRPAD